MTKFINPEGWAKPRGYSNGVLMPASGQLLFIAGQIGWTAEAKLVDSQFLPQFDQALSNVVAVVKEAGGGAEHIARLTIFVTDKNQYLAHLKAVGASYRTHMGKHFPAMSLVEVKSLLEGGALVEIEGTAVLPTILPTL